MGESRVIKPVPAEKAPKKAWVVVVAGIAINLCLGMLYSWSVWAKTLIGKADAGRIIAVGPAAGWTYLTDAQAATPYSICVIFFALSMIIGGRIHDRLGPKVGPLTGAGFLALGCLIAGLSKSYGGLVLGFGLLGGSGLGLAYASTTPAALKWFGPDKRGLVAGLVLSGYGAGALYFPPLTAYLVNRGGVTFSFVSLGIFLPVGIILAGTFLAWPEAEYMPPAESPQPGRAGKAGDWPPGKMLQTWQFYALTFMFMGAIQAGLMIIAHAGPILAKAGKGVPFLVENAWILSFFTVMISILGRIGTGKYSDVLGRNNALSLNCLAAVFCLLFFPAIIASRNPVLLLLTMGLAYWLYGGAQVLVPAYAADFYGTKNLGMNIVLLSLGGWPLGFLLSRVSGPIRDWTGSLTWPSILSALGLIIVVSLARVTKRPVSAE